eukprot:Platyproteum_vivax@DN6687_c0_g1_i1.p1
MWHTSFSIHNLIAWQTLFEDLSSMNCLVADATKTLTSQRTCIPRMYPIQRRYTEFYKDWQNAPKKSHMIESGWQLSGTPVATAKTRENPHVLCVDTTASNAEALADKFDLQNERFDQRRRKKGKAKSLDKLVSIAASPPTRKQFSKITSEPQYVDQYLSSFGVPQSVEDDETMLALALSLSMVEDPAKVDGVECTLNEEGSPSEERSSVDLKLSHLSCMPSLKSGRIEGLLGDEVGCPKPNSQYRPVAVLALDEYVLGIGYKEGARWQTWSFG